MARRAALSALAGSAVEYYDFTLFATASALFLGPVFFAKLGTTGATLASFATFGVAFLARPLGAIVFGRLGDRVGRRHALVWSLTLMGAATFGIGVLPDTATIGIAAPIILVALRLLQGLSAGAEQAGSNALTLEHAPGGQRARYAAWTMQGTSLGTLAGKLVFVAMALLPQATLVAGWWRVPFLLAGPLMLVALPIRRGVDEPPPFLALDTTHAPAPVKDAVRRPGALAIAAGCALVAVGGASLNVYGLSVATAHGIAASSYLLVLSATTALALVLQPRWAARSDRVGRRPVFMGCSLAAAALLPVFLAAVNAGQLVVFALVMTAFTVAWSGANAVGAALVSELFPTRSRHTGAALGTQLGMIVAGFSPVIMGSLAGAGTTPAAWVSPAVFGAAALTLAAVAAWRAPETCATPLTALGR